MNLQGWRRIPVPKSFIYLGEYFLMRWISFFLTAFPYRMTMNIIRNLVRLGYKLDRKYKKTARDNIIKATPPVAASEAQADRIALKSFEHFAIAFIHMLYMPRYIHLKSWKHIKTENFEILGNALKQGKGAILVSAHYGNWEIGIARLGLAGYPVNFVAFQQINPFFNNMINSFRNQCGVKVIPTKGAISKCEEALKRGEAVIFIIDQTGRDEGVDVEFFGRTAPAMWGPANLHLKTGAPIIPFGSYLISDGIDYLVKAEPAIEYRATGNKEEDIQRLTQNYLSRVEDIIRVDPSQWIWFHRRWKKYSS